MNTPLNVQSCIKTLQQTYRNHRYKTNDQRLRMGEHQKHGRAPKVDYILMTVHFVLIISERVLLTHKISRYGEKSPNVPCCLHHLELN